MIQLFFIAVLISVEKGFSDPGECGNNVKIKIKPVTLGVHSVFTFVL